MLLGCKHEDGENKLGSEYHLDEEALDDARASSKSSADVQLAGEHAAHEGRRSEAAEDLCYEQDRSAVPVKSTDETHAEGDLQYRMSAILLDTPSRSRRGHAQQG